jgi:hypothetical protein
MSIEEKYDEIRQLIAIGKEKGYLLYEEINELLPSDITSSEELDDLFSTFGSAGIEVVDSEKSYRDEKLQGEEGEQSDLDLTPGALGQDQRSGPHVPARDGHRAAAHARGRSGDRRSASSRASWRSSSPFPARPKSRRKCWSSASS